MSSCVKRINVNSVPAWGPASDSQLLALGGIAGTLGESFETTAALEIYSTSGYNSQDCEQVGETKAPDRFHTLTWGAHKDKEKGLLAGGLANGVVSVWDPKCIIEGQVEESLVSTGEKHKGSVNSLSFNKNLSHLLASGGSDSQLFIWDLSAPAAPSVYVPGARTANVDSPITAVEWNPKVVHILAAQLGNGVAEIWDLKNKKQVIAFKDPKLCPSSQALAWSPFNPTQIITASSSDESPHLLLWDLKNYAAPVKVFKGHSKGVVSVSWKGELLVSASIDGSTVMWDQEGNEVSRVHSLSDAHDVDVSWSNQDYPILACAGSDGAVRINAIFDTAPAASSARAKAEGVFHKAPEWFKRPCGVAFGFGGRLISFSSAKPGAVEIKKVVTDPELLKSTSELKTALESKEAAVSYCEQKEESTEGTEKQLWATLRTRFDGDDSLLLKDLGFDREQLNRELKESLPEENAEDAFDKIGSAAEETAPVSLAVGDDDVTGKALLIGNWNEAVEKLVSAERWSEALVVSHSLGDASYQSTLKRFLASGKCAPIIKAMVNVSLEELVNRSQPEQWKNTLATVICRARDPAHKAALCNALGDHLTDPHAASLCYIVGGNENKLTQSLSSDVLDMAAIFHLASSAPGSKISSSSSLGGSFVKTAEKLAAQGEMEGALWWLQQLTDPTSAAYLYQRLKPSAPRQQQQQQARGQTGQPARVPIPSRPVVPTQPQTLQQPQAQTLQSTSGVPSYTPTFQSDPVIPAFVPMQPRAVPATQPVIQQQRQAVQPAAPVPAYTQVAPISVPQPVTQQQRQQLQAAAPATQPVAAPPPAGPSERGKMLLTSIEDLLQQTKAGGAPRAQKIATDALKRLKTLEEKLIGASADVENALSDFVGAFQQRNLEGMGAAYNALQTGHFRELGSSVMLALKKVIDSVKFGQ